MLLPHKVIIRVKGLGRERERERRSDERVYVCSYIFSYCMYYVVCRVIWVDNKLLAGRKCDISVCTDDIFKPRDYLVRGKSVFSYCGIILLTRPDYTFSRRATFSPDAFINIHVYFFVGNKSKHRQNIRLTKSKCNDNAMKKTFTG